jgi:Flp pilus assembly pilin Flp
LRAIYLRGKERIVALRRAQTMTEYGLILAAIAAVVYVAYHTMGSNVYSMVIWTIIAGDLSGS